MTSVSDQVALLVDTYVRSAWKRPDSEITDTPTWFQVRTPSAKFNSLNCVRRTLCDAEVLTPRIDALIADHAARGAHFRWTAEGAA